MVNCETPLSGRPRATGTQPFHKSSATMPNNRQFDAACAALRQKLRDLVYTEGVPSTNADGSFVLDDDGDVVVEELRPSAAAAARASSLARSVRKSAARVTGARSLFWEAQGVIPWSRRAPRRCAAHLPGRPGGALRAARLSQTLLRRDVRDGPVL